MLNTMQISYEKGPKFKVDDFKNIKTYKIFG